MRVKIYVRDIYWKTIDIQSTPSYGLSDWYTIAIKNGNNIEQLACPINRKSFKDPYNDSMVQEYFINIFEDDIAIYDGDSLCKIYVPYGSTQVNNYSTSYEDELTYSKEEIDNRFEILDL